ncbi:Hypothetical protein SRAE_0000063500 [Strongyloides ratti]|uniref:Uncharacterized protein n=1 Tax=Strongyloides ratti TaxID=34506 RepID=A0A090MT62_STRRB|nr:Hypothetical protein SRAE_0000063500 [Strongyloides ratti]CEF61513.1 Hypothetical protein SRAE_0000063500 [Strongyloides ratti]
MKTSENANEKVRQFSIKQTVKAFHKTGTKWREGIIIDKLSDFIYAIRLSNGATITLLIAQKFPTHLAAKIAGRISQVIRRTPNQKKVRDEREIIPREVQNQTEMEQEINRFKGRMREQANKRIKEGKKINAEDDIEIALLEAQIAKAD